MTKSNNLRASAQRGVTAVELIIVLAVLAAIIAGIGIVAQNLFRSNNVTREVSEISQIVAKARSFYGPQPTSAGFNNTISTQVGIVGPEKVAAGAIIARPSGTNLGFGPANISGVSTGFALQYLLTGVNQPTCSSIVSDLAATADYALWGPAAGGAATTVVRAVDAAAVASIATVNAGGLNVVAVDNGAGAAVAQTPALVVAACSGATNNGTLTLIYRK